MTIWCCRKPKRFDYAALPYKTTLRVNVADDRSNLQRPILKFWTVHFFGANILALLDTGTVPNIVSRTLLTLLGITPKLTSKTITVEKCNRQNRIGYIQYILVTFAEVTPDLALLIIEGILVDVLIDLTEVGHLQAIVKVCSRLVHMNVW